jgi:hypothetical protein
MDGTLFHEPKAIFMDSNNDAFMVTTVQVGHVLRMYQCKGCGNFSVRAVDSGPTARHDKCEVLCCAAVWTSPPLRSPWYYCTSANTTATLNHRGHNRLEGQR